ncbi:MAG: hypothetical protein ACK4L4_14195 [Gemmobacter sp.]
MAHSMAWPVALLAATLIAGGAGAQQQSNGMRFDLMPVGCLIHTRYNSGDERIEVYVGKKGKTHVTKSYAGPARATTLTGVINTITYDAQGRMIRKDWAGGKWETFSPFSCFSIPGDCRYRYRNADGQDLTYIGRVVPRGDGYVSSGGFSGQAPFNDNTFTFGPFNDIATFREGSTTFKVIRYENCGRAGS